MSGRRLVLILGLLAFGVYLAYALASPGTYQDDDVDRYYMARRAVDHPGLFLDRWGMPIPLALLAVPSRVAGYAGAEATTAAVTAGAGVAVALAAESAGFAVPWVALVFFAAQPMVLELGFSALAEPAAALLVALLLWAWYSKKHDRALAVAGLLPLARIDAGALTLIALAAGWRRAGWRGRIAAILPTLAWNLAGTATGGGFLYVLTPGSQRPLASLGPWLLPGNQAAVTGVVVLFFLAWGAAAGIAGRFPRAEEREGAGAAAPGFPGFAMAIAAGHLIVLTLLAWDAIPFGRSLGFLRHAVTSAPAVAMVAAWGAERWWKVTSRRVVPRLAFAGGWTAVVALVLSHRLIGDSFRGPGREDWRWIVTAGLGVFAIAAPRRVSFRTAASVLAAAAAVTTLLTVKPIGLDPERKAVATVVDYLRDNGLQGSVVYTNHPWFAFLSGRDRYDRSLTPKLTLSALQRARPGSLVLWENHYAPRLEGDVPLESLRTDPRFTRLLELSAGEKRNFKVVLFRRND